MSGRDEELGIDQASGLQTVGAPSESPASPSSGEPSSSDDSLSRLEAPEEQSPSGPSTAGLPINSDHYPDPTHFRAELRRAPRIFQDLAVAAGQMVADLRVGRSLNVSPLRRPLKNMIASVLRHPDGQLWMTKLQACDNYMVGHSVRCSVLSAVFARHLGLVQDKMERLAFGALLCQLGKTRLPTHLLEKREALDPDELDRVRAYVGLGVELMRRCDGVFEDVIVIVENHQERFDGSGYPEGKCGDDIPIVARIAGLVHCYDAMTSVRPHTDRVLSNVENLEFLYDQRDRLFQGQLVEEFIQMLGIYPTGTLVELNNGVVALVMAQNPANRTQPQVLLVLDQHKKHLKHYEKLDMRHYNAGHPDHTITIQRAVNAGDYEIDPEKVMSRHSAGRFGLGKLFGG